MADNYANPLQEAETDITKAQKAISGLLNPKEEETLGKTEPPEEEIKQDFKYFFFLKIKNFLR